MVLPNLPAHGVRGRTIIVGLAPSQKESACACEWLSSTEQSRVSGSPRAASVGGRARGVGDVACSTW
eukprot:15453554-Alexandrium_andersonii.AAC.1